MQQAQLKLQQAQAAAEAGARAAQTAERDWQSRMQQQEQQWAAKHKELEKRWAAKYAAIILIAMHCEHVWRHLNVVDPAGVPQQYACKW